MTEPNFFIQAYTVAGLPEPFNPSPFKNAKLNDIAFNVLLFQIEKEILGIDCLNLIHDVLNRQSIFEFQSHELAKGRLGETGAL